MGAEKLFELKRKIEAKKAERERLNGQLDALKKQLKEMGFTSLKELRAAIKELEADIKRREADIEKRLAELKELVGEADG